MIIYRATIIKNMDYDLKEWPHLLVKDTLINHYSSWLEALYKHSFWINETLSSVFNKNCTCAPCISKSNESWRCYIIHIVTSKLVATFTKVK